MNSISSTFLLPMDLTAAHIDHTRRCDEVTPSSQNSTAYVWSRNSRNKPIINVRYAPPIGHRCSSHDPAANPPALTRLPTRVHICRSIHACTKKSFQVRGGFYSRDTRLTIRPPRLCIDERGKILPPRLLGSSPFGLRQPHTSPADPGYTTT